MEVKKRWRYSRSLLFLAVSLLLVLPFATAAQVCVQGYVGATTLDSNCRACTGSSGTTTIDLTGFLASNYCSIEGNYYVGGTADCISPLITASSPLFAFNINWDADQTDCQCYSKNWVGGTTGCCGDDSGEYYFNSDCCGDVAGEVYISPTSPISCDGTEACCVSGEYAFEGNCVSECPPCYLPTTSEECLAVEELNCTWTPPGTIENPDGDCCDPNEKWDGDECVPATDLCYSIWSPTNVIPGLLTNPLASVSPIDIPYSFYCAKVTNDIYSYWYDVNVY